MWRRKSMNTPRTQRKKMNKRHSAIVLASVSVILAISYFASPATLWRMLEPRAQAATFTVTNTTDVGIGSLREAIANASVATGADTISFNIPPNDPRHFYYINNGVTGTVSRSMIAVT